MMRTSSIWEVVGRASGVGVAAAAAAERWTYSWDASDIAALLFTFILRPLMQLCGRDLRATVIINKSSD